MTYLRTCTDLNEHVQDVDEVAQIIQGQPQHQITFLKLPEDCSGDDHYYIIHNCGRYYSKPPVIDVGGGVNYPGLPKPETGKINKCVKPACNLQNTCTSHNV